MAKRRKKGGARFDWYPQNFADAERLVGQARSGETQLGRTLAAIMPQAIATMGSATGLGGLTCPAPSNDPDGLYRVGLDQAGLPEIQRQDAQGNWQSLP